MCRLVTAQHSEGALMRAWSTHALFRRTQQLSKATIRLRDMNARQNYLLSRQLPLFQRGERFH